MLNFLLMCKSFKFWLQEYLFEIFVSHLLQCVGHIRLAYVNVSCANIILTYVFSVNVGLQFK